MKIQIIILLILIFLPCAIATDNNIQIYYSQDNMSTEILFGNSTGCYTNINNTLDLSGINVVTIKNKIVSDNIIDSPELIFQYKYIALFVYLFVIISIIIGFIFIAKRMWV